MADEQEIMPGIQEVGEEVNRILSQPEVKSTSWLGNIYTNAVAIMGVAFQGIWTKLDQIFTLKITRTKNIMATTKDGQVVPMLRIITKQFMEWGMLDQRTADMIEKLEPENPVVSLVYMMFVGASLLGNYLSTASQGMSGNLLQYLNKQYRPNLPDANASVKAAFIAPEKTGEIRNILAKSGLKEEDIDLLFIASYQLYDVNTLRALYFRGEADENKVFERMREMGFTDTRTKEIMKTWDLIPGVQDIITMAVKEAFTPDIAEKFGQFQDFPAEFGVWAAKQGLSEDWSKKYWAAHWQLPSPQMGFEMLHRQIIDQPTLEMLLRALDVMPFWREKLVGISYNPYARVDVRRMHALGVIKDDELLKAYTDQGYDQDHATHLAEFTKLYNSQDQAKITKSQIIRAYRNSMISRDDAALMLQTIKTNVDEIEWLLINADFEENLQLQSLYIKAIYTRYTDNMLNDLEARTELTKLNLPGARIDALITTWKATVLAKAKMPSKSDLDKFLKADIINQDTYRGEMYKLGYSYQYIDWYLRGTGKPAPAKTVTD